ncbi:hypothetical protein ACSBM8_12685 [Sphingomonas sp. ASY06-1R]|uniref:hypothetical protein n=1 Tax=Sphingomonas sp. ASY06-1R TaxID=3445771 RepID=UPI003FA24C8D
MSKPKAPDNDTNNGALTDAYGKVSERVASAYAAAREKTSGASLEASPLTALLGGIAIGALAGALLPRIEKEKELLAPLGAKIGEAARAALDAGRTAGTGALDESGLSTDQLRAQVSKLVEQALKAAGTAGAAAIQAARESATR